MEEDSLDSQEDNYIGFSWLASLEEDQASEEVEVENSSYDWDNYRENPSFADPEKDPSLPEEEEQLPAQQSTPRRQSSTDNQFLDHENPPRVTRSKPFVFSEDQTQPYSHWPPRNPSEESDHLYAESLLPAGLLDPVIEVDEVFFDSNLEVTMPPKAAPTAAQLHETFTEKVEDFDAIAEEVETAGETPDVETLAELNSIIASVRKIVSDLKKTDSGFETYPEVEVEKKRICVEMIKLRAARDKVLREETSANVDDVKDLDQQIIDNVQGYNVELEIWDKDVNLTEEKMLNTSSLDDFYQ